MPVSLKEIEVRDHGGHNFGEGSRIVYLFSHSSDAFRYIAAEVKKWFNTT
jgi:hypothetical protein